MGKILLIDLSRKTYTSEPIDSIAVDLFFGGELIAEELPEIPAVQTPCLAISYRQRGGLQGTGRRETAASGSADAFYLCGANL